MRGKRHYLEKELDNLFSDSPFFIRCLKDDPVHGIWFSDLTTGKDVWISPSFRRTMGKNTSPGADAFTELKQLSRREDHAQLETILFDTGENDENPVEGNVALGDCGPHRRFRYRALTMCDPDGSPVRRCVLLHLSSEDHEQPAGENVGADPARLPSGGNITDAVFYIDHRRRIQRMNDLAEQLTGFSEPKAKGRDIGAVVDLIDGENGQNVCIPEDLSHREQLAEIQSKKILIRSKDNRETPVGLLVTPMLDRTGRPKGNLLVFRKRHEDRTARLLIHSRLRLMNYAKHHSLEDLLEKTLDELGQVVNSPVGFYLFISPDQKTSVRQHWFDRRLSKPYFFEAEYKGTRSDITGLWKSCVEQKAPVIQNSLRAMPAMGRRKSAGERVSRELVAPVVRGDKVVALLGVRNNPADYSEEDSDIVAYFADLSWEIIQQKQNEEEIAVQRLISGKISELSTLLLTQTNLEDISGEVLKAATSLTKSRYGFVGTFKVENGMTVCHKMSKKVWPDCMVPDKSIAFEKYSGLFGWVVEHMEPVLVNDLKNDDRSCGTPEGHIRINAFLGVPAMIDEKLVGQIALANPEHPYTKKDLNLLQRLSNLFALAVQRQQFQDRLVKTESKKAEHLEKIVKQRTEQLSYSKQLLEDIFTSQLDPILVMDTAKRPNVLDCNPAALKLFGYKKDDFIGRPLSFLYPDRKAYERCWKELISYTEANREFYQKKYRLKRKDGATFPALISVTRMLKEEDAPSGWVVVIHDDSERRAYEDKIKMSEEKFRAIADNTSDWECWLDQEGELLWVNPGVEQVTGYTKEECKAYKSFQSRFRDFFFKADVDIVTKEFETALKQQRTINDRHFRIQRKDGQIRWVSLSSLPIYSDSGRYLGIRSSIRDITEKKEVDQQIAASEKRLALVMDSIQDGVWDWRIDTGEVHFSQRYFTMLGYEPGELPPSYETWKNLVHADDIASAEKTVAHAFETGKPFEMEFRMRTKKDGWRWILGRGRAMEKDENGKPVRMLGTNMDLTERKTLETRLQQSQKLEAMGTLASGIAHDFNNILAGIIGYAELVRDGTKDNPKVSAQLEGILNAGERAKDLISQILAFSRKSEKNFHPIDIRVITKEILTLIRASLPATIEIQHDVKPDLPYIMGDASQLHQVFMNLATNALHAMKEGGTLTIEVAEVDIDNPPGHHRPALPPGEYIRLTVSDTGSGIPSAVLPNIFDPFFTTKKKERGTGLGLSVVHRIVKEHNGDINIDSDIGKGTVVTVYFPAVHHAGREVVRVNAENSGGDETILVVDDEEVLTIVLQDMLESMGYTAVPQLDSEDALALFQKNPSGFDMVLSDITMPRMTGVELAHAVREIKPDIPVILYSGNESNLARLEDEGMDPATLLKKPFRKSELADVLRKALDEKP